MTQHMIELSFINATLFIKSQILVKVNSMDFLLKHSKAHTFIPIITQIHVKHTFCHIQLVFHEISRTGLTNITKHYHDFLAERVAHSSSLIIFNDC
jgi:hypothetical protein